MPSSAQFAASIATANSGIVPLVPPPQAGADATTAPAPLRAVALKPETRQIIRARAVRTPRWQTPVNGGGNGSPVAGRAVGAFAAP